MWFFSHNRVLVTAAVMGFFKSNCRLEMQMTVKFHRHILKVQILTYYFPLLVRNNFFVVWGYLF